jgi:4a-hydroxytetrahydrobiopterin dehydratase
MTPQKISELLRQIPEWEVVEGKRLRRTFKTKEFVDGLELVNRIGRLAEERNHHPDITLVWGKVVVEFWTHDIGGLTKKDFDMAARVDALKAPA